MSSNSTKTLQDFKDDVAREHHFCGQRYANWSKMQERLIRGVPETAKAQSAKDLIIRLEEAAQRYANYKLAKDEETDVLDYNAGVANGLEVIFAQKWQQACDLQKKECADAYQKERQETGFGGIIDKSIILNAPTAINPHKKTP